MIPIRMIISITIVTAIAVMIAIGYQNLSVIFAENQVENECHGLESSLYTMLGSGIARDVDELTAGEGTKRVYSFTLPDSLIYLSFGVDPDPANNGHLQTGLTENGSVICYKVQGGSKHIIWLPKDQFQFREGEYSDGKWGLSGNVGRSRPHATGDLPALAQGRRSL